MFVRPTQLIPLDDAGNPIQDDEKPQRSRLSRYYLLNKINWIAKNRCIYSIVGYDCNALKFYILFINIQIACDINIIVLITAILTNNHLYLIACLYHSFDILLFNRNLICAYLLNLYLKKTNQQKLHLPKCLLHKIVQVPFVRWPVHVQQREYHVYQH